MDIQVPLKYLKYGQDDGAGINARVVGRDDDIAPLAANILARGQIENLVVKRFDDQYYSVANGNRRLAAFHMMYGKDSHELINCTLREVDEAGAFEDSLATAVTAKQLHPVDQYEAFARLSDRGKNNEEIAQQYGLKEKEVRQALALGGLSPKIRDAWRAGDINAETAKAFTMAAGTKQQDKLFGKLLKDHSLNPHAIRRELGISDSRQVGELLNFVGVEVYRGQGGTVVEDLFNDMHSISDEALLKRLVTEKLDQRCNELIADGWSWVKPRSDLPEGAWYWDRKEIAAAKLAYLDGEKEQLAELRKQLSDLEDTDDYDDDVHYALSDQIDVLEETIRLRSFSPEDRAKLGCIVDFENGRLEILSGVKKPPDRKVGEEQRELVTSAGSSTATPPPKQQTTISNALQDRLAAQLAKGTLKALQTEKSSSPLAGILAAIVASQIEPERPFSMPHRVANKLADVRAAISPAVMNAAMHDAFDAKDYFGNAPKPVLLKAISEAINADESRKLQDKTKAEIAKFALANLPKLNWLPKELRTPHYAGLSPTAQKPAKDKTPAAKAAKKAPAKKAAKKKGKR